MSHGWLVLVDVDGLADFARIFCLVDEFHKLRQTFSLIVGVQEQLLL